MNRFGTRFRLSLFGESHGKGVGVTIDGVPAGLALDPSRIQRHLDQRRPGQSPLTTQRKEADQAQVLSGAFRDHATGAPLTIWIANTDQRSRDYGDLEFLPRPGHSDYPAHVRAKGFNDFRGGGHYSGRLTAPLVAAGAVAMAILDEAGIQVAAHLQAVGTVGVDAAEPSLWDMAARVPASQVFTAHAGEIESAMVAAVDDARRSKDSIGGVVSFAAANRDPNQTIPVGLGDPFFDSVESTLSHLLFSVPAIKGVSFGSGFGATSMRGSAHNDAWSPSPEGPTTNTNHAGGLLGGLTNGAPLTGRVAVKPASSIFQPQATIDLRSGEAATLNLKGRHDPCIAIRAVPVIRACIAIGLADHVLHGRQEGLV